MFRVSLGRVRDKVLFKEGNDTLQLYVDGDAARMVVALTAVQKTLGTITNESTDEETANVAREFAQSIFGNDQAEKLFGFYHGDAVCVIEACGKYFSGGLSKKITKAQKR
jgi:hypothetical protein